MVERFDRVGGSQPFASFSSSNEDVRLRTPPASQPDTLEVSTDQCCFTQIWDSIAQFFSWLFCCSESVDDFDMIPSALRGQERAKAIIEDLKKERQSFTILPGTWFRSSNILAKLMEIESPEERFFACDELIDQILIGIHQSAAINNMPEAHLIEILNNCNPLINCIKGSEMSTTIPRLKKFLGYPYALDKCYVEDKIHRYFEKNERELHRIMREAPFNYVRLYGKMGACVLANSGERWKNARWREALPVESKLVEETTPAIATAPTKAPEEVFDPMTAIRGQKLAQDIIAAVMPGIGSWNWIFKCDFHPQLADIESLEERFFACDELADQILDALRQAMNDEQLPIAANEAEGVLDYCISLGDVLDDIWMYADTSTRYGKLSRLEKWLGYSCLFSENNLYIRDKIFRYYRKNEENMNKWKYLEVWTNMGRCRSAFSDDTWTNLNWRDQLPKQ